MFRAIPLFGLVLLGGCLGSNSPAVMSAGPTAISLKFPVGSFDDARKAARKHCQDHNQAARLVQAAEADDETITASFSCQKSGES